MALRPPVRFSECPFSGHEPDGHRDILDPVRDPSGIQSSLTRTALGRSRLRGRRRSGACCLPFAYPHGIADLLEVMRQMDVSPESALLPWLASGVGEATDAKLVIFPAVVGLTTISMVTTAPLDISPRVQETVPVDSARTLGRRPGRAGGRGCGSPPGHPVFL